MRLLTLNPNGTLCLNEFVGNNIPPYAILSHTWGPDEEEVSYQDLQNPALPVNASGRRPWQAKAGAAKLEFCVKQAAVEGLSYSWIDTCCIDKSSSAELSESINSMFKWYSNAAVCFVYLADVDTRDKMASSRWFTRGWTLQELLAPANMQFFGANCSRIASKATSQRYLHHITQIPTTALNGERSLQDFTVEERLSWAKGRETKREEDMAYCLFGLFDVHMPLIYGEGQRKATNRLMKEIKTMEDDEKDRLQAVKSTRKPPRSTTPSNNRPPTPGNISIEISRDSEIKIESGARRVTRKDRILDETPARPSVEPLRRQLQISYEPEASTGAAQFPTPPLQSSNSAPPTSQHQHPPRRPAASKRESMLSSLGTPIDYFETLSQSSSDEDAFAYQAPRRPHPYPTPPSQLSRRRSVSSMGIMNPYIHPNHAYLSGSNTALPLASMYPGATLSPHMVPSTHLPAQSSQNVPPGYANYPGPLPPNHLNVDSGQEISVPYDITRPLSLTFHGDMDGRTLQIVPTTAGRAELVIIGTPSIKTAPNQSSKTRRQRATNTETKTVINNTRRENEDRRDPNRNVVVSHSTRSLRRPVTYYGT